MFQCKYAAYGNLFSFNPLQLTNTTPHYTILYYTTPHYTALHYTAYTTLYYTILQVLPESQAEVYEKYLRNSEIIAVNGKRVCGLEEFRSHIIAAIQESESVNAKHQYQHQKE